MAVILEDETAPTEHTRDEDVEHCNRLTVVRTPQMNREVQRELRADMVIHSRADERPHKRRSGKTIDKARQLCEETLYFSPLCSNSSTDIAKFVQNHLLLFFYIGASVRP